MFCLGFLTLTIRSMTLAASVNMNIEPSAFDPDNVTINVNDQVVWAWVSDSHSTTSDDGLWDSGIFDTGHVFTNTFTSAGSFPYFCIVHGFTGSVNVQAGDSLPTVAITSPTDGAAFASPAIVPIIASANDSDGITASLGTGAHALTAVAIDNLGLATTSAVVVP